MIQDLPISHIFPNRAARKIDESTVRGLVKSIRDIGIINPLRVRAARRMVEGIEADAFEVVNGGHRLKAAQRLSFTHVPCFVADDDDLHAELAMIDENLMRAELKGIDRDDAVSRRKEIYEQLHPETKLGVNQHTGGFAENANPRFTKATAEAVGVSERTVQLAVERSEKICAEAKNLVRGTEMDTFSELEKLKKVDVDGQVSYINRRLSAIARKKEEEREERQVQRDKNRERVRTKRECDEANAARAIEHFPHEALEAFVADLFGAGHSSLAQEIKARLGVSIMDQNYSEVA